jgi:ABC-type branched-subunit amino acid transport system substrate-binding protein
VSSRTSRGKAVPVFLATAAVLLAGCSSAAGSSSASATADSYTGPVTAGVLHAFTGQNAFFGLNAQNACKAAAMQINAAGGIMGHQLNCSNFDTKGDPADAVPVTTRMLASADHLVMVVGPDGNDIPSVLPLFESAKIPEMNTVGDPRYDSQTSPYFWRLMPSDSAQAPALAYYPVNKGLTKIVDVFTNDLSAQTTIDPFHAKLTALGGTSALSLTITPGQASYQTEVAKVLAANPQALVGELDARTAATFLTELQQQNNGKLIPFIVTQRATQPDWAPAVAPAIGTANLVSSVTSVSPDLELSGPGYDAFKTSMAAVGANQHQQNNPFVAATYDGVIAFALAMDLAKSIDPSTYVSQIPNVTSAKTGAVVVSTYADAVAALKAGKTIQYVGAAGVTDFNKNNTANRPYSAWTYDPSIKDWKMGDVFPLTASQP